jgi:hypothetical protein
LTWRININSKDEEEWIKNISLKIHKYDIDAAAVVALISLKPTVYFLGEMGRCFISPAADLFSDKLSNDLEKFFQIFEKRENIDKVVKELERLNEEEKENKKKKKENAEHNT